MQPRLQSPSRPPVVLPDHYISSPRLRSGRHDVLSRRDLALPKLTPAPLADTCSTITTQSAPGGTGAPVIISDRFSRPQRAQCPRLSGAQLPHHAHPPSAQIRNPAGKAIARRSRKRRLIPIRHHRFRQNAPRCGCQPHAFHPSPRPALRAHTLRLPTHHRRGVLVTQHDRWKRTFSSRDDCRKNKERRPFRPLQRSGNSGALPLLNSPLVLLRAL